MAMPTCKLFFSSLEHDKAIKFEVIYISVDWNKMKFSKNIGCTDQLLHV